MTVRADTDELEQVARIAIDKASRRVRAAWRGHKVVHYKGAVDLVTETDRQVETLIVHHLRRAFPDHAIVAEEASTGPSVAQPAPDRHVWYVDPLDGTTNFAHGYPHFAVSLAVARGTDLLFGMVHDPLRRETFVAHRGRGATLNGQPISVSSVDALEQALLATGFPYDRREHVDFYLGFIKDFVLRAQGLRRGGSAALDLCYVACGRLDGFWELKLKPWDTAAGALIVRQAGGTVTNLRGGDFTAHGEQTLASNGRVHAAMVQVLSARLDGAAAPPP